ncbi:MAG: hypothetical protein LBD23_00825 [Oscillospiraceae bacterium]|nr:hypothetical protein [Oscillospiraceae bacterium]
MRFRAEADFSNALTTGNPWTIRGGNSNNGANSGVFATNNDNGNANTNRGARPAQRISTHEKPSKSSWGRKASMICTGSRPTLFRQSKNHNIEWLSVARAKSAALFL